METKNFYADTTLDTILKAEKDFFININQIRRELGPDKRLIDDYLNKVLDIIDEAGSSTFDSSGDGEKYFTVVLDLISKASRGIEVKHHLYKVVKEKYEICQRQYKEFSILRTVVSALVFPDYIKWAYAKRVNEMEEILNEQLAQAEFSDLCADITDRIGKARFKKLNQIIEEKFILVSRLDAFLQGSIDQYSSDFTYRDSQTGLTVIQLILDQKLKLS